MGSSYFGEPSLGINGRSGSSRKGKKSNPDRPKQPQRGLGVAQLERIRLHNQMNCTYLPSLHTPYPTNFNQEEDVRVEMTYTSVPSSSSSSSSSLSSFSYSSSPSFGFHPNIMVGMREMEAADITYGESQSSSTARWNHKNGILKTQYSTQPSITRQLLSLQMEDSVQKKRRKDWCDSMDSSSQNSYSSETQEIDLDLKLSL